MGRADKIYHYHECKQCGADLGICGCANSELRAYWCQDCSNDPEPLEEEYE